MTRMKLLSKTALAMYQDLAAEDPSLSEEDEERAARARERVSMRPASVNLAVITPELRRVPSAPEVCDGGGGNRCRGARAGL